MNRNKDASDYPSWLLPAISWTLALYLFVIFHINNGFPPKNPQNLSDWIILGTSILLFIFPFLKSVKIGDIIEVERQIKEVQENVKEFKSEIRQTFTVMTSMMNNLSNTVNVNFASNPQELRIAQESVEKASDENTSTQAQEIKKELLLDDEDTIMSLARTRIKIEQLLRKILDKQQSISKSNQQNVRYLSARSLFQDFAFQNPQYISLKEAFNYVNQICNAAIHGQRISGFDASSALDLGANIIAILEDFLRSQ